MSFVRWNYRARDTVRLFYYFNRYKMTNSYWGMVLPSILVFLCLLAWLAYLVLVPCSYCPDDDKKQPGRIAAPKTIMHHTLIDTQ